MPLGTIDRTPPPFFRQGASALTKLIVCAGLALLLMVADARYAMVDPMRAAVATLLLPFQRALLTPVDAWEAMTDYTQGLESAVAQERASRARLAAQAVEAARAQVLEQENRRLRALLDLQPTLSVKSQAAEVLYEAADPFSRKAFINRGQTHGVLAGSPVINERGVLGQITRVYPDFRGDPAGGPRRHAASAQRAQSSPQRSLWRGGPSGHGIAIHGHQRRCASGRPAHHQRH